MADKLDYKKEYKDLYLPGTKPALVTLPAIPFIYVDGVGAPETQDYQTGVGLLYALSYTIKMSKLAGSAPAGYHEYVVPPLEGLWDTGLKGYSPERSKWRWTSMIRQPNFVTAEVFEEMRAKAAAKHPEMDFGRARFARWEEGLCLQAMHKGPYATEPETFEKMQAYMRENKLEGDFEEPVQGLSRRHHEIYIKDPRRTAPQNLLTVLRHPVRSKREQ